MPRTRKSKPTDIPEAILEHFAGPARPMTASEIDEVMQRFKKAFLGPPSGGPVTAAFRRTWRRLHASGFSVLCSCSGSRFGCPPAMKEPIFRRAC